MEANRLVAYEVIDSLAREAGSEFAFLASVVEPIAESMGGLYALLTARLQAQLIDERWWAEGADADFWKQPTDELLTRVLETSTPYGQIYQARESVVTVATLGAPLRRPNGGFDGAVIVVAPCAGEWEAREIQAALESLTHLVSSLRSSFQEGQGPEQLSPGLEAATHLSKVSEYSNSRELAFALTNNLRVRIHADQVALGLGAEGRIDVLSVSGYDEVDPQSPGTGQLRAAMEECLDAGERIVVQEEPNLTGKPLSTSYRLHRQWHTECERSAVASVPIAVDGGRTAILSLRRSVAEPFREDDLDDVCNLVEPFLGSIGLLERSTRSLTRHARDDLRGLAAAAIAPGRVGRKLAAVVLATLVFWMLLGSVSYRLSVPVVLQPAESRRLSAPYEAVLESISVLPGDHVRAGDLMATFRHEELLMELERLMAELAVEQLGAREGMAGRSPNDVEMARARQRLLRAKISTAEERVAAAHVRAPYAGQVIAGDMRMRVGERLPIGEPLFELTSGELRLELEIPESAAAEVGAGQMGQFASHARPGDVRDFEITRIEPRSVTRLGQSIYLAEASAALDSSWMRPGIEGVAKIRIGDKPITWALFHRMTDYLRLRFWL